jgi:hypothetical protein
VSKYTRRFLVAILIAVSSTVAACSSDSTTAPPVSTSTAPLGVWHADIDRGLLHSVDIDTRFLIGTALLRNCDLAPPGGCSLAGVVSQYSDSGTVKIQAAYLQETIIVRFTGDYYTDDTLRGTLTVTSNGTAEPSVNVTMHRTK